MPLALLAAIAPSLATLPTLPTASAAPLEAVARLTITPAGKVEGCAPLIRSVDPAFDAALCRALTHESFAPARDRADRAAYGVLDVQVRLGPDGALAPITAPDTDLTVEAPPPGVGPHPIARLALAVDAMGQVEDCDVVASSGSAALDAAACRAGPRAVAIEAARDGAGRAVASVQSMNVGFGAYDRAIVRRDPRASARLGDAGAHFPPAARRSGTSGYAVIACVAAADGALDGCRQEEAFPAGAGFGEAVLAMAGDGTLKAAPGTGGRAVRLRIDFPRQPR